MRQSEEYKSSKETSDSVSGLMSQIETAAKSAGALGASWTETHAMLDDAEAAERAAVMFKAVKDLRTVFRVISDIEEGCQQDALELYQRPSIGWRFLNFLTLGLVGSAA